MFLFLATEALAEGEKGLMLVSLSFSAVEESHSRKVEVGNESGLGQEWMMWLGRGGDLRGLD